MLKLSLCLVLLSAVIGHHYAYENILGSNFCRDYPKISRLFRLHHRLYLELYQFPGKYILYDLHNGTFEPHLVRLADLMGESNEHIFESIISASSLGHDIYDQQVPKQFEKSNDESDVMSDDISMQDDNSSQVNNDTEVSLYESETESLNQSSNITSTSPSLTSAISQSFQSGREMLVRIWGYFDAGFFPLEHNRNGEPIYRVGYEDFRLRVNTGTFAQHEDPNPDDTSWEARRTAFSFDCFIYLPQFGAVAIIEEKHKPKIVRHQLSGIYGGSNGGDSSDGDRVVPFDVRLKVFYSSTKYASCVDLNLVVALLSGHNELTIIDRDLLALSYQQDELQVFDFVETDLHELLCKAPLTYRALLELKQNISALSQEKQMEETTNTDDSVSLMEADEELSFVNMTPRLMSHEMSTAAEEDTEGHAINRALFIVIIIVLAVFVLAMLASIISLIINPTSDVQLPSNVNHEQLKQN